MKRVFALLIATLIIVGIFAGCAPAPTITPAPTATPEPAATPEPTATPVPTATPEPATTPEPAATPEPASGVLAYPFHSRETVLTGQAYRVAGTFCSGVFQNHAVYQPEKAFDGNPDTIWASDVSDNPWIVADLGEAVYIGRVEVCGRPDGNNVHERNYLEIQVSNDPGFSTYETLGSRGRFAFGKDEVWTVNGTGGSYRYVRLTRTDNKSHFTISELRVCDTPAELIASMTDPLPAGAQMIVSRCGKTLAVDLSGSICLWSYDFLNLQRWIVETSDGTVVLRNCTTGKYLCSVGGRLELKTERTDEAVWHTESATDAGWVFLRDRYGRILLHRDGVLAIDDGYGNTPSSAWWFICPAYGVELPKGDTSFMRDRYGVMYHLIPDGSTKRTMSDKIDTEAIADQLAAAGVGYFQVALGQNSGYFNSDNKMFASIVKKENQAKVSRFTKTNIPEQLFESLSKRGIDLMFYTSSEPPYGIVSDVAAFGMNKDQFVMTADSAMLWSLCLREWSLAYGDKVKGWWADGGYASVIPEQRIFTILANGMKAGNPNAAIAFNPGIVVAEWVDSDEFTCGETDFPFGEDRDDAPKELWITPENVPILNKQWYELTFLSVGWCFNTFPRSGLYRGEAWGELVRTILEQGGTICLDVPFEPDNGYTIRPAQYDILLKIKEITGK